MLASRFAGVLSGVVGRPRAAHLGLSLPCSPRAISDMHALTAHCILACSQISIAPSAPARSSLEKWLGKSGVGGGRVAVCVEDDSG